MTGQKESHKKMIEIADAASKAAIIAQQVAQDASDVAKKVVEKAENTAEKVLLFAQTMEYIQKDIAEIKQKLDNKYVSKEEFKPVKLIAYGLISIVMLSVVSGLMLLLFKFK